MTQYSQYNVMWQGKQGKQLYLFNLRNQVDKGI